MPIPPVYEWPRFRDIDCGYLCLTRLKDGHKQHGFLIEGSWNVNLGYIWDGGTGEEIKYESRVAVFEDGWEVD